MAPPEQRRGEILQAALRCFGEKGYHATTMDDLARTAGLSKGSLYWHFESKRDVFVALFDLFTDELFAAWDAEAARGELGTIDLLQRFGELVIEELLSHEELLAAWPEFFVQRDIQERFAAMYRESRRKLGVVIRRGIEAGELRDHPSDGLASTLIAAIEGLVLQATVDAEFEARRHWPVLWDVLVRGMRA